MKNNNILMPDVTKYIDAFIMLLIILSNTMIIES